MGTVNKVIYKPKEKNVVKLQKYLTKQTKEKDGKRDIQ